MDTGRVGACHRLEIKRRKFLIVINDVVKNKSDVYSEYLTHSNAEAELNFEKSKMFVRRALVRQKVLQQCMKMKRLQTDTNRAVFGRYGGKTIESFGRDIESFIAYNHPKMRRQRYLQKLLNESFDKGVILKPTVVEDRVASWMERSYTKHKLKKAKREKTNLEPIKENRQRSIDRRSQIPRLPVLSNPFYTGKREPEVEEEEEQKTADVEILKISNDLENVELNDSVNEDKVEKKANGKRATLVLPPIKTTRAMVST